MTLLHNKRLYSIDQTICTISNIINIVNMRAFGGNKINYVAEFLKDCLYKYIYIYKRE